jgi:hypothetical protein
MKNFFAVFMSAIFLLAACIPAKEAEFPEFTEPDPETYVNLMQTLREYFYYRKQAVITGELDPFYERYPALDDGENVEDGINTEAWQVHSMQSLAPFDGNIFPEYYEKIRVREMEGEMQVLVHGMSLYLWKDSEGRFDESGGEFKMMIFLIEEDGNWQVYRTDEVTLKEWKGVN